MAQGSKIMTQPLDVTASLSKSELIEQQFLEVLESCESLGSHHAEYSSIPYESVDRLCDLAQDVNGFVRFLMIYKESIQMAVNAVFGYASTVDNWRVKESPIGFGVRDFCSLLVAMLQGQQASSILASGNFESLDAIAELLDEWRGVKFHEILEKQAQYLLNGN
ncbi:hypothetical protein [Roseofilum sp. Guam]|uniref:hypothetical protein n=1 Tax=Roseofilum sp. Guam TaxID=2821502 RepID=UPI001B1719D4|nr:hypothetical protein [Roseofilum sp. Guam]MBP0029189.1 hypothetical protein [Roseofilum sp. Guam]